MVKVIKHLEERKQTDESIELVLSVPKPRPVEDVNGEEVVFVVDDSDYKRKL